jgi:hypothetical protein
MIRRVVCAVAIVVVWLVVLGCSADLAWNTPLSPHQRVAMEASKFHVVMGAGVEDGDALRVGSVGDDGNALQTISIDHLRAADYPILRYHFDEFPQTLEVSLVFRRADKPNDVQAVTIPWAEHGWTTLDLRGIAAWQGEIIELGFAEYATPQIVPASVAFRPFRFDRAELWSPSWRGGIAALYTSWFGYVPWALLSVSALTPSAGTVSTPALLPALVIGLFASLLAAAITLRRSRRWLLRAATAMALAAWLILDAGWLIDLHAKHGLTEDLYAGKSWQERARLVPDQETAAVAEQVKAFLSGQDDHRILVASDANYTMLRLLYQLLPLNAAPMANAMAVADAAKLPADCLFLLYENTTWRYDDQTGLLSGNVRSVAVTPVFESGDMHLYRLRSAPP